MKLEEAIKNREYKREFPTIKWHKKYILWNGELFIYNEYNRKNKIIGNKTRSCLLKSNKWYLLDFSELSDSRGPIDIEQMSIAAGQS